MSDCTIPSKQCNCCKQYFPVTPEYWHKNKREKDGLCRTCKICAKARSLRNYYANPDLKKKYAKQWAAEHPEKAAASKNRYQYAHLQEERERAKAFRTEHPDERRLIQARYRDSHRSEIKVLAHQRRTAQGHFTAQDIELQIKAQGGHCWWCGKPFKQDYHVDHRIPIAKGGTNDPSNLVLTCPHCNLSKGTKLPSEWNGRLL